MIDRITKYNGDKGHDLGAFLMMVRGVAVACRVGDETLGVLLLSCLEGGALAFCLANLDENVT